jgi:hypothetical protein
VRTRKASLLAAAAVALALTSGCGRTYPPGPDGTVTDRTHRYYKSSGWRYWLTVTTPTGPAVKFRVTRDDYHHCFHQSHYPACSTR